MEGHTGEIADGQWQMADFAVAMQGGISPCSRLPAPLRSSPARCLASI